MKTTVHWHEEGPNVVTISAVGWEPARLFGAPFVAVGLYLLYFLLDGVIHPSQMTIFGWLLLPVFTAAFLVPGWLILFARKRTRLDATRREATEEFDFLVYTRRVTTRISRDAHVMLRYKVGARRTVKGPLTDRGVTSFNAHVYLVPGDVAPQPGRRGAKADPILLAMFPSAEKAAALEFAQRAARFLGVNIRDLCVEHGEIGPGGVVVERLDPDLAD